MYGAYDIIQRRTTCPPRTNTLSHTFNSFSFFTFMYRIYFIYIILYLSTPVPPLHKNDPQNAHYFSPAAVRLITLILWLTFTESARIILWPRACCALTMAMYSSFMTNCGSVTGGWIFLIVKSTQA